MRKRARHWFLVTLFVGLGAVMVAWLRRGGGADAVTYRASENARAFHRPGCRFYDSVGATIEFTRPTDAIAAGFTPCKVCKP